LVWVDSVPDLSPFDFPDPADLAGFQANLYAMRMSRGSGQDILDDPLCEFSRPLVCLQHDTNPHPGLYLTSIFAIHAAQFEVEFTKKGNKKRGLTPIFPILFIFFDGTSIQDLVIIVAIFLAFFRGGHYCNYKT